MICFFLVLSGCANVGQSMSHLRPGMSKQEIQTIIGNPNGYQARGEYEVLKYLKQPNKFLPWDTESSDYYVIMKDGKAIEFGAGKIFVKEMPNSMPFMSTLH